MEKQIDERYGDFAMNNLSFSWVEQFVIFVDVIAFDVALRFDRLCIGPTFFGVAAAGHRNTIASRPCLACPLAVRQPGVAITACKEPISAEILGKNEIYYGDLCYSLEALAFAEITGIDVVLLMDIGSAF